MALKALKKLLTVLHHQPFSFNVFLWHNAKVKTFCLNYTFVDFLIVQSFGSKNCIKYIYVGKSKTNTEAIELQISSGLVAKA